MGAGLLAIYGSVDLSETDPFAWDTRQITVRSARIPEVRIPCGRPPAMPKSVNPVRALL
jgi:hypothetical protein